MNLLTYEGGDRILIVGDFNIHVCCETGPLVKYFLTLINTFNLTQWVRKPTHVKGHMLDLVLSNGLVISITDIKDCGISDNFPVMFDVSVCNVELRPLLISPLLLSTRSFVMLTVIMIFRLMSSLICLSQLAPLFSIPWLL